MKNKYLTPVWTSGIYSSLQPSWKGREKGGGEKMAAGAGREGEEGPEPSETRVSALHS